MLKTLKALWKAAVFTVVSVAFLFSISVVFIALALWLSDLIVPLIISMSLVAVMYIFWEAYKWEKEG